MAETRSIKEQITAAVATALEAITVANGYQINVSKVSRPRWTGENNTSEDYSIDVIQGIAERVYMKCSNPPVVGWKMRIACDCVLRLSEYSTVPMDQAFNQFEAEVQKCLMAEPTFGGLVFPTELAEVIPYAADGFEGIVVWFTVTYQVSEDDPGEQR